MIRLVNLNLDWNFEAGELTARLNWDNGKTLTITKENETYLNIVSNEGIEDTTPWELLENYLYSEAVPENQLVNITNTIIDFLYLDY